MRANGILEFEYRRCNSISAVTFDFCAIGTLEIYGGVAEIHYFLGKICISSRFRNWLRIFQVLPVMHDMREID
jgi:hypothetical protein